MSIQRRLAVSITLVLVFSLVVGFALTYEHVLRKVRTEMQAALVVGALGARNTLDDTDRARAPEKTLRALVHEFDGDRHVQAVLLDPAGHAVLRSQLAAPDDPSPSWFYHLVVGARSSRVLDLPSGYGAVGSVRLDADPHNEVAEAWSDMRLTLVIMAVFFAAVLALAYVTIRAALAPIRDVVAALSRIGDGDYAVHVEPQVSRELAPLRNGFNAMADRLEQMRAQNRALTEQMNNLQEEERAELARDLHDDVAPFLFAVGADAAMIRQYLAKGRTTDIAERATAIGEAVKHMHHHLKDVLRRLAPSALLDLGLPGAIDNLIAFWATRRPGIVFSQTVTGEPLDPPLDAVAFRVVQESVSNAIRHGDPRAIDILIDVDDATATIVVEDDGAGFPEGEPKSGFGLVGMHERVRTVGGSIRVRNRADRRGAIVEVALPLQAKPNAPQVSDDRRIETPA